MTRLPNTSPTCRCCGKGRRKRAGGTSYEGSHGWCEGCCKRWRQAGKPESGPPPPKTRTQCGDLSAARRARLAADADAYDREWQAGAWARRLAAAVPVARDLARVEAAGDAEGRRLLLARVRDWPALVAVTCGMDAAQDQAAARGEAA